MAMEKKMLPNAAPTAANYQNHSWLSLIQAIFIHIQY